MGAVQCGGGWQDFVKVCKGSGVDLMRFLTFLTIEGVGSLDKG